MDLHEPAAEQAVPGDGAADLSADELRGRAAAHRDGVIALTLALFTAFFFPVVADAGTANAGLRWATAAALLVAGLLLRFVEGRKPWIAAWVLLVVAGFLFDARWLAALAVLFALDHFLWPPVAAAWRRVFPADAEREETTSDVLESVATAFVLALVVREFAFEAFKIPTGSMETTIYGDSTGAYRRDAYLRDKPILQWIARKAGWPAGDRLLAAKSPLLFEDPQRWSIMVFKYPLFRPTNFIKRLIGLPGEHVEIRGGDIYVNGAVAAKPDEVQETLWFPALPDDSGEWRGEGMSIEFTPDNSAKWTFETDGAEGVAEAGKTGWISRDMGSSDLRVSFDLDPSRLAGGAALVRIDADGRRVEFEAKADGVWLSAPGAEKTKLDCEGVGTETARFGFAVADRVARVYRDGRVIARAVTGDVTNFEGRGGRVALGVSGGTARFGKVAIERDIHYSPGSGELTKEWDVPAGCYFMLGDNTTGSRDSRLWKGRVFRLKSGGEPIVADETTVRLDDESSGVASVRDEGEHYVVLDSHGVRRKILKSELEGGAYHVEPQPFVRREDLVGRAFFIFFPFPPFGEWRPRILP